MAVQQVTAATLAALKTSLQTSFNKGLADAKPLWPQVAQVIPSASKSNTYAWLSQFPAFREWVGARLHKAASERAYSVANRKFESTLDVQRTDIEDDEFSHYAGLAYGYGQSVVDLMNDLVFGAVKNGFTDTCYDGQYFFDTDHPVAPNEDGTGTPVSVSNMQAGSGEPWVLMCTSRAPKPFYLQERIKPEFVSKTNASNSDAVFENDVFSFGGRWRGDAAYGFWQTAFGSKAALTAANFTAAYKAMMKFKGDGMRPLNITPDTLVCGPDNMADAEVLLKAMQNANGSSNTNYNKVKLVVVPHLAI
jgi:phage major head subunit gpT-like protein